MNIGDRIGGKYRLLRQLGAGAMGVVFEALNETTQKRVAIKLLSKPSDDHRHRMMREARVCGQITHRNVIEIYDAGETERGDPYLVMQLLSGETLADLLRRKRRLENAVAAQIGRDIARALTAAHAANVIHRDLKPANVFLHHEPGSEGFIVKVLDFGVAKDLAANESLVTAVGGAVGSPAYMSPEALRAERNLDARTDIWALGVVLFEMLAGVRPFQGRGQELLIQILTGPIPRVSEVVRYADPALDDIVNMCLQREREKRIAAAAVVERLLGAHVGPNESSRVFIGLAERAMGSAPAIAVPISTPKIEEAARTPEATAPLPPTANAPALQAWMASDAVDVTAPLPPSSPQTKSGKSGTLLIGKDAPSSAPVVPPMGPRGTILTADVQAIRAQAAAAPLPSPPPPTPLPAPPLPAPPASAAKRQSATPTIVSARPSVKPPAPTPTATGGKKSKRPPVVAIVLSAIVIAGVAFAAVMGLSKSEAVTQPANASPAERSLQNH